MPFFPQFTTPSQSLPSFSPRIEVRNVIMLRPDFLFSAPIPRPSTRDIQANRGGDPSTPPSLTFPCLEDLSRLRYRFLVGPPAPSSPPPAAGPRQQPAYSISLLLVLVFSEIGSLVALPCVLFVPRRFGIIPDRETTPDFGYCDRL